MERNGTHVFTEPSSVWGYLPQINEWSKGLLEWSTNRVGGADHIPVFSATPICKFRCYLSSLRCFSNTAVARLDRGEVLENFTAVGPSKKAAKEAAATLMALSGHCVSNSRVTICFTVYLTRICALVTVRRSVNGSLVSVASFISCGTFNDLVQAKFKVPAACLTATPLNVIRVDLVDCMNML